MAKIKGNTRNNVLIGTTVADQIFGLAGNDTLIGRAGNDKLSGGLGSDKLSGGAGNDKLFGDAGADRLTGGSGNDTISPGDDTEADAVNGGAGSDTVSYAGSTAAFGAVIDLAFNVNNAGTALNDTYISIENVIGTSKADALTGDNNDNVLTGDFGSDTLRGAGGNDTLLGGDGADDMFGGSGVNAINCGNDIQTDRVRLDPNGVANISNFDHAGDVDLISVQSSLFGGINATNFAATDSAQRFFEGTAPLPANGFGAASCFLHVIGSTEFYYDPDGSGAAAPVLVAIDASFANGIPTSGPALFFEFF
ncbi:MAG: hypothetical protein ABL894_14820 [Hyphomicrobium sp.]